MRDVDFPVNIDKKLNAISAAGFGTFLILDHEKERSYDKVTQATMKELGEDTKAYKIAERLFMQTPGPSAVAIAGTEAESGTELVAFLNELMDVNNEWFFLVCTDNSPGTIKALAAFAEIQDKMYAVTTQDVERQEDGSYKSIIEDLEYEKTFVAYHNDEDAYLAEGLAVIMSHKIGSKTAKFKTIKGVLEADTRQSLRDFLHDNGSFTYQRKLGVLQTTEGYVTTGEYIDTILGEYWIRFRMEEAEQRVAVNNDKIGYTNQGIGLLVAAAESVLGTAVERNILLDYKTTYKKRQEVDPNKVANRIYNDLEWIGQMAGAIHKGPISGTLTYENIKRGDE